MHRPRGVVPGILEVLELVEKNVGTSPDPGTVRAWARALSWMARNVAGLAP